MVNGCHRAARGIRSGFTLMELVTALVMLGILAAVVMPVYLDYKSDAKKAACKGSLGAMRAAIFNYHAWKATNSGGGRAMYPSIAQLGTVGTVLQDTMPDNPYDTDGTRNNIVDGTGVEKGAVTGAPGGWCYNPSNGQIWANTNVAGENRF